MKRLVTIASLASTDGTTTHYAIYRALLHYRLKGEPWVDLNKATHIATEKRTREPLSVDTHEYYLELAAPHANQFAPAFSFDTERHCCYAADPDCQSYRCREQEAKKAIVSREVSA